jgi:hypothetical protein
MPITPIEPNFKIIKTSAPDAVVALDWEEYLELAKFMADVKRYMEETKILVCNYRKSLNETYCKK